MDAQKSFNVLLIEDNPGDARLVREMLAESTTIRFEITHAKRMEEASQLAATGRFNAILLDLSLPDSHGLESVNKAQAAVPDVPIVVMTNLDDEATAVLAVQAGAQNYMVKGEIGARTLARTLHHAVERHKLLAELRDAQEKLRDLATHDALTGLCNRRLFDEHLAQAIEYAKRYKQTLAVLFLDLDKFKQINDTLGHAAGDALLQSVARTLTSCIRKSDIAARLGGDEFVILLNNLQSVEHAGGVALKICEKLRAPTLLDGHGVAVSTSVGIAAYPSDGDNAEALVKNADAAMYHAKHGGRDAYRFYALGMTADGK